MKIYLICKIMKIDQTKQIMWNSLLGHFEVNLLIPHLTLVKCVCLNT